MFGRVNMRGISVKRSSYDALTQAFLTATGITDLTQIQYVDYIATQLRLNNLISRIPAYYPFVGGTDVLHSYNLMNTATYRITWYGGVTHNSNGITGNGVNGYGTTGFVPSTHLQSPSSAGIGLYNRTATVLSNSVAAGSQISSSNAIFYTHLNLTDGRSTFYVNNGAWSPLPTLSPTTGAWYMGRTSTTQLRGGYRTSITNYNVNYGSASSHAIAVLALNSSGAIMNYSTRNLADFHIDYGLSVAEAQTLATIKNSAHTILGRNMY